jgi:hypothetical protein
MFVFSILWIMISHNYPKLLIVNLYAFCINQFIKKMTYMLNVINATTRWFNKKKYLLMLI